MLTRALTRGGVLALVTLTLGVFAPAMAYAEDTYVAHSFGSDGKTVYYASVDEALSAGYEGSVIVMDQDWLFETKTAAIEVTKGANLTINMNAHMIKNAGAGLTVKLDEGSNLTLTSNSQKTFDYNSYLGDVQTTTGGLVSNSGKQYGAVYMGAGSALTMHNVAVAGCFGYAEAGGGGVTMSDNTTLTMESSATIEYNLGNYGAGGVRVNGANAKIQMSNASIKNNKTEKRGGGIYVNGDSAEITMEDGSNISNNNASAGGGIHLEALGFKLLSSDHTGVISGNAATGNSSSDPDGDLSGGGIHVAEMAKVKKSRIEGLTIAGNSSSYDGGGIEIDTERIMVKDCVIKNNSASYDGGGVYVNDSDNTLDGCTITGNYCASSGQTSWSGREFEGGGVYVSNRYDIEMKGLCTVKGNTRGKDSGNADDVFLDTLSGGGAKAYITGGVAAGSTVGVRTGITGDRRIGENIKNDTEDCFFIDLDGYYVSYGTDAGGDMWQRHATKKFQVKVNDEIVGQYTPGSEVTLSGASSDASKAFKCWSAEGSTGLYPFSDYVSERGLKNSTITFTMPQNDVNLKAEYIARTSDVSLNVEAPRAGTDLSIEGTIAWTPAGSDELQTEQVVVSWYEKKSDGSLDFAVGTAKVETTYVACVSVAQNVEVGRAFAFDLQADDVPVIMLANGVQQSVGASEVSVDASGTLGIVSNEFTTDGATVVGIDPISLSFPAGTSRADFEAALPQTATALKNTGSTQQFEIDWSSVSFDNLFTVSGLKLRKNDIGFNVPLKDDEQALPEGMRSVSVTLKVTDVGTTTVDVPIVTPAAGTYGVKADAAKFDGEKMTLTATAAEGATIKYSLSHYDGSTWQSEASDAAYDAGIDLAVVDGSSRSYKLEIWAVKGDAASQHDVLYYTVEDDRQVEQMVVTVMRTDTGKTPDTKKLTESKITSGGSVSLVAPVRPGYVFEKWQDEDGGSLGTDRTLSLTGVNANRTVTAVYNPVITALNVGLDVPVADGKLAANAKALEGKIGTSESYVDISDLFAGKDGKVALEWSPEVKETEEGGKSATAEHGVVYTAVISTVAQSEGVKYVVSPTAEIKVNGVASGNFYIAEKDEGSSICVVCPATASAACKSLGALEDVELSYKEALNAQKSKDAGDGLSEWGLPTTVKVNYACGESENLEIVWTSIDELDQTAADEQELVAKGTVTYPDYVDHEVAPETVTVKVKVAAPKAAAEPTASVKGGTYKEAQKVELACATEGATIRYTTDSSEPTEDSPAYDGTAIEVSKTTTIKARAYLDGMTPSKVATFAYTIDAGDDGKGDEKPDKKDDEDDSGKDDSGKDDSGKKDDGSDKKEDGKSDTDADDTDENGSGKDGGNADSGSGSGVASDTSTTTVTTVTTEKPAAAKSLPRTGDYTLVTVAALLAIGLAAVAAGILATRRKK